MLPRVTMLRMLRLCMKELRESLRDRRTIVTLVLMPLLVYPLLSLVLNRVLLTSVTANAENLVTFGIGSQVSDTQLPGLLEIGYMLIQDREAAPTFVESELQDGKVGSSQAGQSASGLPQIRWLPLADDGRDALRTASADLIITRKVVLQDEDGNRLQPGTQISRKAVELVAQRYSPINADEVGFDADRIAELIGHLQVNYRKGDPRSERALQVLERILAAVNNEASREVIQNNYEAPFRLYATPVIMKSDYSDMLATMVPLVLVLMTMAGAVYPAIDLTAGERERGTMEALIVSPTPSYALLLAKYSAVVTVALLTALANLTAMTITLWVSGIGALIFGDGILSAGVIGTILVLLVLFTMFFAALLLAVTSFAKSFKEAQAYLIPLMLLALTPGVMSLLPGIRFTSLLATVPLVNIVLLAREVLVGEAEWNAALVAVICNAIYALAALAVASRLFGTDASSQGSRGSWRDLLVIPQQTTRYPGVDQMALTMALMFPLYFVTSSALPGISSQLATKLWASAAISFVLILGVPLLVCLYRRIELTTTFRLGFGKARNWLVWFPAALLISASAWTAAHEIFIAGQALGIGTIDASHLQRVAEFRRSLQQLPLWQILFVFAITPAVCEEFLFRGFVLSSLHKYSAAWAIAVSAVLFGLMHVLTSNVLAVERFLPTTFMGLILGFIAVRSASLWPGMLVHALHNGLLLCLSHYSDELKSMRILVEDGKHLPLEWLAAGAAALVLGLFGFWQFSRRHQKPYSDSPSVKADNPGTVSPVPADLSQAAE